MSKQLTTTDIIGTIEGLQNLSRVFHDMCIQGSADGVIMNPVELAKIAVWLKDAGDELYTLIPERPVTLEDDL